MKKFLASVGNAKLLGKQNGAVYHIADVRTLTESTLSFANTMEEVRAGQGAQLYGRFAHDSGMTVNLTDAMFDMSYIALQTGAETLANPTVFHHDNPKTLESADITNGITLDRIPQPIGESCGLQHTVAWVRLVDCKKAEEVEMWEYDETAKKIKNKDTQFKAGDTVCIDYFITKPEARGLKIGANFIPAELILIITTKLFAGDSTAPETGKPVGEITVKIPRFSLDGTFDLSMAMSAAATISLQGTALAVNDGTCEGNGIYAEVVEVINNSSVLDNLVDVLIDEESLEIGAAPAVWGQYTGNSFTKITDEYYIGSTGLLNDGKFTGVDGYILVYNKPYYKEAYTTEQLTTIETGLLTDSAAKDEGFRTASIEIATGKTIDVEYFKDAVNFESSND